MPCGSTGAASLGEADEVQNTATETMPTSLQQQFLGTFHSGLPGAVEKRSQTKTAKTGPLEISTQLQNRSQKELRDITVAILTICTTQSC